VKYQKSAEVILANWIYTIWKDRKRNTTGRQYFSNTK